MIQSTNWKRLFAAAVILTVCIGAAPANGQGIKYYGNWGGPGYGGGEPIDALDRAYRRHDQRYAAAGSWGWAKASKADGQVIEETLGASLNPFSDTKLHGRVLGPVSAGLFSAKPSLYRTRVFGETIYLPSTGVTSVGLLQVERGVKGARWGVKQGLKGANGIKNGAGKVLRKIF